MSYTGPASYLRRETTVTQTVELTWQQLNKDGGADHFVIEVLLFNEETSSRPVTKTIRLSSADLHKLGVLQ